MKVRVFKWKVRKFTALLLLCAHFMLSCKEDGKEQARADDSFSEKIGGLNWLNSSQFEHLKGNYVGRSTEVTIFFGRSRTVGGLCNFSVDTIDEKKKFITGHMICEGMTKTFKATYEDKGENFLVANYEEMNFPIMIRKDGSKLFVGFEKKMELKKRIFKYNPSHQIDPKKFGSSFSLGSLATNNKTKNINASTKKLNEADLNDLSLNEVTIIHQAIYARHGYAFKDSKYIYFFENKVDWYAPYFDDVDHKLTDIEKANILLLEKFEKNAKK